MNKSLLAHFNRVERYHWWWHGRRLLLQTLLSPHSPRRILDVGCGTGETITFLRRLFPHATVHGLDNSPQAIRYARSRRLPHLTLSSAQKLPYRDATFDAVLFLDVLEHIRFDHRALQEARRVLKPGGTIIITVPALPLIWSAHDSHQGHFRRYTRARLHSLARRARLHPGRIGYFNFFLSPLIIPIRLLTRLPLFSRLGSYDSRLNYSVADRPFINRLLTSLFCLEILLLRVFSYPFGISIFAQLHPPPSRS